MNLDPAGWIQQAVRPKTIHGQVESLAWLESVPQAPSVFGPAWAVPQVEGPGWWSMGPERYLNRHEVDRTLQTESRQVVTLHGATRQTWLLCINPEQESNRSVWPSAWQFFYVGSMAWIIKCPHFFSEKSEDSRKLKIQEIQNGEDTGEGRNRAFSIVKVWKTCM